MAKNNGENPGFDPLPLAPIEISENMSKIVLKSQIPMAIKLLLLGLWLQYKQI